jgi:hypothetical protein
MGEGFAGKRGGWMNHGGGPDGEKQVALAADAEGEFRFHLGHRLLEPDDIRTQQAAAARAFGRDIGSVGPFGDDGIFGETFGALNIAVEFDDVAAAGALVEAVHVLGNEGKAGQALFHFDEREVGGIGPGGGDEFAAPVIPFPDEAGVFEESAGSGELLGLESRPQAGLGVAKRGDAALRRNAGAGQDHDGFCAGKAFDELQRKGHGVKIDVILVLGGGINKTGGAVHKKAAAQVLSSSFFPTSRTSFQLKIVCAAMGFAVPMRRHDRLTGIKRREPAEKFQKNANIFEDAGLSPI